MFFEKLSLVEHRDKLVIKFDNKNLITIHNSGLSRVLEKMPSVLLYLDKFRGNEPDPLSKLKKEVGLNALLSAYKLAKEDFYKRPFKKPYNKSDLIYFKNALDIIELHDVSYEVFVKAQVHGLKLVGDLNNARIFPSPKQLSTSKAEDRLVDYLALIKGERNTQSARAERVYLSKNEKDLPLKENTKFMEYINKIRRKESIELNEILYVEACYKARRTEVPLIVEELIEKTLLENRND